MRVFRRRLYLADQSIDPRDKQERDRRKDEYWAYLCDGAPVVNNRMTVLGRTYFAAPEWTEETEVNYVKS